MSERGARTKKGATAIEGGRPREIVRWRWDCMDRAFSGKRMSLISATFFLWPGLRKTTRRVCPCASERLIFVAFFAGIFVWRGAVIVVRSSTHVRGRFALLPSTMFSSFHSVDHIEA